MSEVSKCKQTDGVGNKKDRRKPAFYNLTQLELQRVFSEVWIKTISFKILDNYSVFQYWISYLQQI